MSRKTKPLRLAAISSSGPLPKLDLEVKDNDGDAWLRTSPAFMPLCPET
ncbi:hypothetical protein [Pararhizobium polonicum]|jgi:hypothetical protein|nr:hypothetical protein [Pararhizobium polonicum]